MLRLVQAEQKEANSGYATLRRPGGSGGTLGTVDRGSVGYLVRYPT